MAPPTGAPSSALTAPARPYRGPYPYDRVRELLTAAVTSRDPSAIARAFNEVVYSDRTSMRESLPAVREFLTHANPYVRYSAANMLYTAGDDSGYTTLLNLVRSEPVVFGVPELARAGLPADEAQVDLRREAARRLAQFRQHEAGDAILALYQATGDGALIRPLAKLGIRASATGSTQFSARSAEDQSSG